MQSYLRVKIKSLAAEARIIRFEEARLIGKVNRTWLKTPSEGSPSVQHGRKQRTGGVIREMRARQAPVERIEAKEAEYRGLHHHRTREVRSEARAALLAYGFLKGTLYRKMEKEGSVKPPKEAISRLVIKYGRPTKWTGELDEWLGIEPKSDQS